MSFGKNLQYLRQLSRNMTQEAYSNLRVEEVAGFRYIEHTVISTEPESDAISRMYKIAEEKGNVEVARFVLKR